MDSYIIHFPRTFQAKYVQSLLDKYPKEYWASIYGQFWIVQEILAQNKNLIHQDNIEQLIYDYMGDIPDTGISWNDIQEMITVDILSIDEEGNVFSPYQKEIYENRLKKKKQNLDIEDLKRQLLEAKKLIKRLNEKIDFLQNKPKIEKIKNQNVVS